MNILKVFLLLIAGGAALIGTALSEHVHSPRWKVKTLEDAFVVSSQVVPTSIAEQDALPAPTVGEQVTRLPSERTVYEVTAQLIQIKKEFDGDYHLVLEDPATKLKMVAEIPDTNALEPLPYREDFARARQKIDAAIGRPGLFAEHPSGKRMVEITGIGFFDEPHILTPDGMAPNGREIHPVLHIKLM